MGVGQLLLGGVQGKVFCEAQGVVPNPPPPCLCTPLPISRSPAPAACLSDSVCRKERQGKHSKTVQNASGMLPKAAMHTHHVVHNTPKQNLSQPFSCFDIQFCLWNRDAEVGSPIQNSTYVKGCATCTVWIDVLGVPTSTANKTGYLLLGANYEGL